MFQVMVTSILDPGLHVFFIKKPVYKQPITSLLIFKKLLELQRKSLRNFRQTTHQSRHLVERNAEPKPCQHDVAVYFSSHLRILFVTT